jgi:hypothetical protein
VKVTFLQSGGFVGAPKGCDVDSALLEPEAAREIEKLVEGSGLTASGKFLSGTARDLKQYEIVVERNMGHDEVPGERKGRASGSSAVRVVFDDASVPAQARALLSYLKQRARPRPPA